METIGAWIEGSGALIYVLAPLFTVAVAILPIPAEIPALINGMAFGPVWGSLITWLSALFGAQVSFELARRFGRPLGERLVPERVLTRADGLVEAAGWPALLALRLIPTVAFTALNWSAGLTKLRRSTFVWTTAVGILPGAIAFTATGSGLLAVLADPRYRVSVYALATLLVLSSVGLCYWRWRRNATEAITTTDC